MIKTMKTASMALSTLIFTACENNSSATQPATHDTGLTKIIAYANTHGGSEAPSLQDYTNANVIGIDNTKLLDINEVVKGLDKEDIDTTEEIQALVKALGVTAPSEVSDTTPPVITVTGTNPTKIVENEVYIDAGATANDAKEGAVEVTTAGTVDASTPGDYTLTYTAQDSTGNKSTTTRIVVVAPAESTPVADTTAPVITLAGSNPTKIVEGNDAYTDAGATANDAKEGAVEVTTTGTVDSNTPGDYTLIYTATDSEGNTATATRIVKVTAAPVSAPKPTPAPVADTTAPVITLAGVNPANVMQNEIYTDAGATANDAVDGSVEVTVEGAVDTQTLGDYTLTYTATDSEGNTATATRVVTVKPFTLTHNGTTYGVVTSPYTGKVWLDRNLGAAEICTDSNDEACYGDYYQWGRGFDGHQDSTSSVSSEWASDGSNAGSNFITSDYTNNYDWASIRENDVNKKSVNWSKIDGSSVCPIGFRVPTAKELKAELLADGSAQAKNRDDAFNSFLKLPSAGGRDGFDGSMYDVDTWVYLWSSSADGIYASSFGFDSDIADSFNSDLRAYGHSIRCLKD